MSTIDDTVPDGLMPADVLASTTPVAVYGFARAKAGKERELEAAIRSIIPTVRAEQGYEQYAVHTTEEAPGAFAFYEVVRPGHRPSCAAAPHAGLLRQAGRPRRRRPRGAVAPASDRLNRRAHAASRPAGSRRWALEKPACRCLTAEIRSTSDSFLRHRRWSRSSAE